MLVAYTVLEGGSKLIWVPSAGLLGAALLVQRRPEGTGRLELHGLSGGDLHDFAGARIAALASGPISDLERF